VAYYEWLLEQLGVSDVKAVLTPLFCLLAWAKEPITEGTMKVLLQTYFGDAQGWDELFRKTLEYGHQMLQQRPTSDDETGWTIYHDSFRQHLLESETVSFFRGMAQGRWLKVCEDWKALASQEPSLHRYILRHYAEHLYDKWRMINEQMTYDALCRLALDSDFKQAQTEHLPKEPNLPLKTVQLALDAAIQLEDAPMMARLLIEHAKRAQSEEETPLQAWRKGHRDRALRMATEIVFERDHKLGTLWSLLLAWVAESEGEREWSKRFLDEVRKRWEGGKLTELGDWQREMAAFLLGEVWQVEGALEVAGLVLDDDGKGKLATSWASKELFDQALKVAEGIEGKPAQAWALGAIAKEMVKAGMVERAKEVFDQALKVAKGVEGAWWRAEALREIAGEMAKARMFDQALQMAEEIEIAGWWAEALREIVEEMAEAGMFDQALKVAEGIKGAEEREKALRAIVEEMAKAGVQEETLWQQTLKVAEEIEIAGWRAEALRRAIAGEMAKARMFDQALKVAERIRGGWEREKALRAIAGEMAKARMFDQALQMAEEIEIAGWRAEALREIVEEMAEAGMFDQALEVAERIEWAEERAKAFGAIAGEMAKARMEERAKEVFDQALKVAKGIKGAVERTKALWEIAREMAEVGMFDQALKVAEEIEIAGWRAEALRAIVEEMAKAGVQEETLWQQTLKVAEGIERADERAKALRGIAERIAKAGMEERAKEVFDQALQVIDKGIEDAGWRAEALRAIAGEMAKARMFDQALQMAEEIEIAGWRAEALREIVEEMAEAGMFDQALKVAERIEWAEEREEALRTIARKMAEARMFDQALKVAERIENALWGVWRAKALGEIAGEMARTRMLDQALQVVEGIEDAWGRVEALKEISEGMAKAGVQEEALWRQALQVVEGIEDAEGRAKALGGIAEGMAKAGMKKQAGEIFDANLQKSEEEGGVIAKMGGVKLQKSAGIFAIMSTTLHAFGKVSEIDMTRVSGNFFVKGDLDTFSSISALHHLPNHHPPQLSPVHLKRDGGAQVDGRSVNGCPKGDGWRNGRGWC
jgi:tetratricopeptide (TPR) repeat protein